MPSRNCSHVPRRSSGRGQHQRLRGRPPSASLARPCNFPDSGRSPSCDGDFHVPAEQSAPSFDGGAPDVDPIGNVLASCTCWLQPDNISLMALTFAWASCGTTRSVCWRHLTPTRDGEKPAPGDPRRVEGGRLYHPIDDDFARRRVHPGPFHGGILGLLLPNSPHHYRRCADLGIRSRSRYPIMCSRILPPSRTRVKHGSSRASERRSMRFGTLHRVLRMSSVRQSRHSVFSLGRGRRGNRGSCTRKCPGLPAERGRRASFLLQRSTLRTFRSTAMGNVSALRSGDPPLRSQHRSVTGFPGATSFNPSLNVGRAP